MCLDAFDVLYLIFNSSGDVLQLCNRPSAALLCTIILHKPRNCMMNIFHDFSLLTYTVQWSNNQTHAVTVIFTTGRKVRDDGMGHTYHNTPLKPVICTNSPEEVTLYQDSGRNTGSHGSNSLCSVADTELTYLKFSLQPDLFNPVLCSSYTKLIVLNKNLFSGYELLISGKCPNRKFVVCVKATFCKCSQLMCMPQYLFQNT